MKALVVGASGLVGGALRKILERDGTTTVGTCWSQPIDTALRLDVRDRDAVLRCFEATRPDVAFLATGLVGSVNDAEVSEEAAHALTVEANRNVAMAATQCQTRMVYYSTDHVFDGTHGPYSENDSTCPRTTHGKSKWQAEQILQACGCELLIIRTDTVFGWDRRSRNLATQVWETLGAGNPVQVAADDWTSPTFVDYLAEVSTRLIQVGASGIFNVVGKDRMPRADLASAIARAMGLDPALIVPVSSVALGQGPPRPREARLSTDKLVSALGTEPLDLEASMKRFRRQWRVDTHITHGPTRPSSKADALKQEILKKVHEYHELAHQPPSFTPFETRVQYSGRVFGAEEMVNLVDSSLDFWLTLGPYGELFEQKLKRFFGARDFIVVNSGSTANLTAVLTLMSHQTENPLRPGDEVITPAVTFPTTLAPIVHSGLVPVFVDCVVGTYNIDPDLLEAAVSDKTRAVMVPHTLGNPCDMDVISDVVQRHGLFLIEDSCDALGSTFRDQRVGSFGDLATLSFYPAHHITLGEGGGVIVNNPRLSRIARSVRDWGRDCWCAPGESNTCGQRFGWQLGELPKGYDHKYTYSNLGYNFKPTDMQAAIGVAQANRIEDFVAARRRNFSLLYGGLEAYQDYLILPTIDSRSVPSWFGFPVTVQNGLQRQELVQWLESANIETRQVFGGNILKQPGYKHLRSRTVGALTETDRVMRDTFFVGVYPGLTEEMIAFVIDRFGTFFRHRSARGHV